MQQWTYDVEPRQIGGVGSDYGAWFVGRVDGGAGQFISVQIGQCGDAPSGDGLARKVCDAMLAGLNASECAQ